MAGEIARGDSKFWCEGEGFYVSELAGFAGAKWRGDGDAEVAPRGAEWLTESYNGERV